MIKPCCKRPSSSWLEFLVPRPFLPPDPDANRRPGVGHCRPSVQTHDEAALFWFVASQEETRDESVRSCPHVDGMAVLRMNRARARAVLKMNRETIAPPRRLCSL